MIPIKLEIRNFLPYRAPDPLRFEGIHLACLTGPNGAGKSSLLDAITWALWGWARAKRDEDLIHQGQENMHVQLDFEQEGVLYRVLRRRTRGKRGVGTLDFFVKREDGQFTTINQGSMRATQDKINALLRLDYDTFVHSAFLQQGKADAFTVATPARRKQILGDILGLAQWDTYEEQVKAYLKDLEQQLALADQRIHEIEMELQRKPALLRELEDASISHNEAQGALKVAQELLEQIKSAPGDLRNAQENKINCERRLREYQRDVEGVEQQIVRQEQQISDYAEIIAAREEIQVGYAALQSAREADQSLSDKLLLLRDIDQERADLRSQLEAARARLESEADALERRISDWEAIIEARPDETLEAVQFEVGELRTLEIRRDDFTQQDNALREERAGLMSLLTSIETEGKNITRRAETLKATEESTCPLCGQELTPQHREQIVTELIEEAEQRRAVWREHKDRIALINDDLQTHKGALDELEVHLKRLPTLIENAGKLQAQVDAALQAEVRLAEDLARLSDIRNDLDSGTFAAHVRDALLELDLRQEALGYDQHTHDDARRQLREHHRYDQLQTRLAIAVESLPTLQEAINGSYARRERLNAVIAQSMDEVMAFDQQIAELLVQVAEYTAREAEMRRQHTLERTAYERVVNAQQQLSALENQAVRKEQLERRRETFRLEESIYRELRTAFGKNGIPAMIIETAIPELEITANDLLARMTDGRMHMRLMTQREKITGGVAETLDIEISDELGTRNYEMYSGGEAFRINFAVRVALSQMLARRAGAHLRTLFIDEGFGTQDEAGRYKLVEAITAIQNDFDMILVITHIDELRDSFPVHIIVDKTSDGSRVSVR